MTKLTLRVHTCLQRFAEVWETIVLGGR